MRTRIIACETVAEEIRNLIPEGIPCKSLEFGLHRTPEKLNAALQKEIDETKEDVDTILLGYGMCSKGCLGLEAQHSRLVIPKVDDCIGLFLGSRAEYSKQHLQAPGTYYLTKGWIECGDDPYTEYLKMTEKYGHEKAHWLESQVIKNYTRLALINTGNYRMGKYRRYGKKVASFFSLTFEEIPGSNMLVEKLIEGRWDEDFVVIEPGGKIQYDMFLAI